jgi:nucleotide-binding universal stress UspA family protein
MYGHILISTDGSEVSQKGVTEGLALAKALGARATLITVTENFPMYSGGLGFDYSISEASLAEYAEGQNKSAASILASAKGSAEHHGIAVDTVHVSNAQVADAIIATAKDRGCGLIVMASHGRRGFGRLMLGSKTSEVLTHSAIPVLVVR